MCLCSVLHSAHQPDQPLSHLAHSVKSLSLPHGDYVSYQKLLEQALFAKAIGLLLLHFQLIQAIKVPVTLAKRMHATLGDCRWLFTQDLLALSPSFSLFVKALKTGPYCCSTPSQSLKWICARESVCQFEDCSSLWIWSSRTSCFPILHLLTPFLPFLGMNRPENQTKSLWVWSHLGHLSCEKENRQQPWVVLLGLKCCYGYFQNHYEH